MVTSPNSPPERSLDAPLSTSTGDSVRERSTGEATGATDGMAPPIDGTPGVIIEGIMDGISDGISLGMSEGTSEGMSLGISEGTSEGGSLI